MNPIRIIKLLVLLLLAACGGGGGVDSGGTGITPVVVSGPISGFGSIIVGSVRFDDSTAEVEDLDGARRGRDELKLGMTVDIESGAISDSALRSSAIARRIRFESEITGLVSAVDVAGDSFTVLGQRVLVDATTVFDERFSNGLASLVVAQPVEVYAQFDARLQRYRATRVEPAALGAGLLRIRGPVAEVNPALSTLRIGTASYRFDRASDVPVGLAVGTWVRLRLQFDPSPVSAWEVQRFTMALRDWVDADEVRVEGIVNSRDGARFVLNGRAVDGSAVSLPADLVAGARAEVRGVLRAGLLRASRVTVRSESEHSGREYEFDGPIDAVDAAAGTLRLRGFTISTRRPGLRFDGGSAADLVPGRRIELRAVLSPDRRQLEATRISFR